MPHGQEKETVTSEGDSSIRSGVGVEGQGPGGVSMPGRRKEAIELRRPPERAGSDGDQRKAGEGNGRRRHHRSGERQKARRETGSGTDGRQRSGGGGRVGILGIPEGERDALGVLEWVCTFRVLPLLQDS
ncbi:hypothetical protein GW17_00007489 [Ensete ventricosum]|nr:hypothetical protein GW17_00007489 [Ensete ventricosum]